MRVVRFAVAAVGLIIVVAALVSAARPYREIREFRQIVACQAARDNCFVSEQGFIRGKRSWTTTTTHTDANGNTTSTTTNYHYEVTWERASGAREAREVSWDLYRHAAEGGAATFRLFRGEVVGVDVMGATHSFLPRAGRALSLRLCVAWFGLGVVLWWLLFGFFDGLFMLAFRTMAWMFIGLLPISFGTESLAYGVHLEVWEVVFGVVWLGICLAMLIGSLHVAGILVAPNARKLWAELRTLGSLSGKFKSEGRDPDR